MDIRCRSLVPSEVPVGALEEASSVFSANHHRLLRDISKCAASRVKEPIPNLGSRYIFFSARHVKTHWKIWIIH